MKRKNVLLGGLSFAIFALTLTSCGIDMNEFEDASRIHERNNYHYTIKENIITNTESIFGDYIKLNATNYQSVFTGKEVYANTFKKSSIGNFDVYIDETYYNEPLYYDAFGNSFQLNDNDELKISHRSYLFVGGTSDFYKMVNPKAAQAEDKTIHALSLSYIENDYFSDTKNVIVTEVGDTYFQSSNVYSAEQIYEYKRYEVDGYGEIHKLNDRVYEYVTEDNTMRFIYDESSHENQVKSSYVYETQDEEYTTLMEIKFGAGTNVYKYEVKPVKGITNEFHFVDSGTKFYARHNATSSKIKFVPYDYIELQDYSKALVLCKKILDDGELSNKWYTVQIDQNLKVSSLSDDVHLFNKDEIEYVVNGDVQVLNEGIILEVLDNNLSITYCSEYNRTYIENDGHYETFNGRLINKYSIDNKYYIKNNDNRVAVYNYMTSETSEYQISDSDIIISSGLGLYLSKTSDYFDPSDYSYTLYMYEKPIINFLRNSTDIDYNGHNAKLFQEEISILSLRNKNDNATYVFKY